MICCWVRTERRRRRKTKTERSRKGAFRMGVKKWTEEEKQRKLRWKKLKREVEEDYVVASGAGRERSDMELALDPNIVGNFRDLGVTTINPHSDRFRMEYRRMVSDSTCRWSFLTGVLYSILYLSYISAAVAMAFVHMSRTEHDTLAQYATDLKLVSMLIPESIALMLLSFVTARSRDAMECKYTNKAVKEMVEWQIERLEEHRSKKGV